MLWTNVVSLLLLLLLLSSSHHRNARATSIISKDHGVVSTDHGNCSEIGSRILEKGGHAVEAAVAAALCLGVVSPASSGIGGGAFMLVRSANGSTEAYDMRESAPANVSDDMYGGNATRKSSGPLSIAVPGELLGLHEARQKYHKLPWTDLVAPAAALARDGFVISPYLHAQMKEAESSILADEGLRSMFTSDDGTTLLRPGDTCYNKRLAETLDAISSNGSSVIYNGSIGAKLTADIKNAGGVVEFKDLQRYVVRVREATKADVMGVEVLSMPPPSCGGLALTLILNILAQYRDLSNISDPLLSHREIEAMKHAFARRMDLADPDFVIINDTVAAMSSKELAANLSKAIFDNTTFGSSHYGGRWRQLDDHGGSHVSVVDGEGNAVSMTTSINSRFGSGFFSRSTGIILNNEMDAFSMPDNTTSGVGPTPSPLNYFVHGKRPLSSMTPAIVVKDGQVEAVVGSSGGSFIIGAMTEVLVNLLVRRKYPLASVLAPRLYNRLIPDVVSYENWTESTTATGEHFEVPKSTRDVLVKKGHVLESIAGESVCNLVVRETKGGKNKTGRLVGVSDPRSGGSPAGF